MVVKADLRVQHTGCLMTSLAPGTVAMQVSSDEECDLILVQGDGVEVERVVRHIESDGFQPFDVMGRTPNSALVRTRNPPVGVIPTILSTGCTILWPAVYRDGWEQYTILAPSEARLRILVRRLAGFGNTVLQAAADVPTESVGATVPVADLAAGLTRRQLEALQLAVRSGYYEVPRRVEARDLAAQVGLGRSTFEEHLRKAELHAMRRFAGILDAHEGLAAGATKTAGRPRRLDRPSSAQA
ncbi:MAG: helix-turn-helix domain-containing protein [Thermoplasmatota archaeon]